MSDSRPVILSARRTPIGRFLGGLSHDNLGGFDGKRGVGSNFVGIALDALIQVMFRHNSINQPPSERVISRKLACR